MVEIRGRTKDLFHKKFYISIQNLQTAKLSVNASTFAKSLLVAAFSDKALYECTLMGGQYQAAGRANITKKTALDQDVVAVIAG